jgi:hypothetical protein
VKVSTSQLSLFHKGLQKSPAKLSIIPTLKRILEGLTESFLGGNELQIWQTYDRFGNNWWHAYDPVTGCRTRVQSEAEMRAWIENRYYN